MGIPRFKFVPKPRIRLYQPPFPSMPKVMRWECFGPSSLLSCDSIRGYGETPSEAFFCFTKEADRVHRYGDWRIGI